MRRTSRLFELIQILRAATRPMTADEMAQKLEVSVRTIYRDIAALQAMRTPIEGESGVGYVLRRGYDLPPLNFDLEEIEALRVGLSMLARTGDSALNRAAIRICEKIEDLHGPADWLVVSPHGAPRDDACWDSVPISVLRDAIRSAQKLEITYRNLAEVETVRTVRPLALVYYQDCVLLAAWCELRKGFRHFRTDRLWGCTTLDVSFAADAPTLRSLWAEQEDLEDTGKTLTTWTEGATKDASVTSH